MTLIEYDDAFLNQEAEKYKRARRRALLAARWRIFRAWFRDHPLARGALKRVAWTVGILITWTVVWEIRMHLMGR